MEDAVETLLRKAGVSYRNTERAADLMAALSNGSERDFPPA